MRASGSRKLPLLVFLPSGSAVRLARLGGKRPASVVADTLPAQLAALSGEIADVTGSRGEPLDLLALSLEDFHVLRTVALAIGLLPEEPVKRRCLNCDEILTVGLSQAVPLGPILDGELDDRDLDEPFDFEADHPLSRPPTPGAELAEDAGLTVRLAPLSVEAATELWAVLGSRDRRRLARRLGIARLGDVDDPRRIARQIDKLDEERPLAPALLASGFQSTVLTLTGARCPGIGFMGQRESGRTESRTAWRAQSRSPGLRATWSAPPRQEQRKRG